MTFTNEEELMTIALITLANEHGLITKQLEYIGDMEGITTTAMLFNVNKDGHPKNHSTVAYTITLDTQEI